MIRQKCPYCGKTRIVVEVGLADMRTKETWIEEAVYDMVSGTIEFSPNELNYITILNIHSFICCANCGEGYCDSWPNYV